MNRIPPAILAGIIAASLLAAEAARPCAAGAAERGRASAEVDTGAAVAALNRYRSSLGLSKVAADSVLMKAARQQAIAMARAGVLSHDINGSFGRRMESIGIGWSRSVETIGVGYDGFSEMLSGWVASAGHRANLQLRDASRAGIAQARDINGRVFWVVVMATPVQDAPSGFASPAQPQRASNATYEWGAPLPLPFGLTIGN